tara:strand:+ start:344 stop:1309 length:966 start_codon:yes stop_codon:yes gene_type:complete
MSEGENTDRQIWLRAFYGFDPENTGFIGFTRAKDRETMFSQMRDGDLVLIYGAVDEITHPDLKSQALGFLEIKLERCVDRDRMSDPAWEWRKEHGFEDRWNHAIKVRRAWRINNRVHIRTIAPTAYQTRFRFDRTNRAKLLEPDECRRALTHPVRQANVFGEPPIVEAELQRGTIERLLKPSRGIPPKPGKRTANYEDGDNHLYLMLLSANAGALLGPRSRLADYALVKVGRSNDPKRRLKEMNGGFPETSTFRWQLHGSQKFESADRAHELEQKLMIEFAARFHSQGGEFFAGDERKLIREFEAFCTSHLPAILGALVRP